MKHKRSRKPRLFTVTAYGVLGVLLSAPALPHGGGLNSSGCHNDNVNGGYHCHRDGEDGESLDAEVLLGALVAAGIVYLIYKKKQKRRSAPSSISDSTPPRALEMPRRDPIRLALTPATNSRGRVDGLGFQLRFRF